MEETNSVKTIPVANNFKLFVQPRVITMLLLGISSGLPLALTGSTLQAWYTVAGVSIITIGALSLVGMPYVYKFLWSPLLDRYVPPLLGRRRGWIMICQLLLAVVLAAMAFLSPQTHPWGLAILALAVAFISATQDIAIDAYRTDVLRPEERGLGSATFVTGYRIAMLLSGGLAMVLAGEIGWKLTYLIIAVLLALEMLVTFFGQEPETIVKAPTSLMQAVVEPFREFLTRKMAIMILLFIVIYKLSDAFALALSTSFLIRGVGFSLVDVGAIYKVVGLLSTVLGTVVGGFFMPRLGMYRSLMLFGILQGISNLAFMLLAIVGKKYALMVTAIFIEYFCGGLGTVAFVAFLMALCDQRYTATQFALLSALSAVGRVFVGPSAGLVVEHFGWIQYFLWAVLLAIPGLLLLWWLRKRVDFENAKVS